MRSHHAAGPSRHQYVDRALVIALEHAPHVREVALAAHAEHVDLLADQVLDSELRRLVLPRATAREKVDAGLPLIPAPRAVDRPLPGPPRCEEAVKCVEGRRRLLGHRARCTRRTGHCWVYRAHAPRPGWWVVAPLRRANARSTRRAALARLAPRASASSSRAARSASPRRRDSTCGLGSVVGRAMGSVYGTVAGRAPTSAAQASPAGAGRAAPRAGRVRAAEGAVRQAPRSCCRCSSGRPMPSLKRST